MACCLYIVSLKITMPLEGHSEDKQMVPLANLGPAIQSTERHPAKSGEWHHCPKVGLLQRLCIFSTDFLCGLCGHLQAKLRYFSFIQQNYESGLEEHEMPQIGWVTASLLHAYLG